MNHFGTLILALRKSRGLTLEAASKRTGTNKGYTSGIESGRVNPPSPKYIQRLAKLYGVDYLDLQELAFVSKAPKAIRERMFSRIATNPLLHARINQPPTVEIPTRVQEAV